MNRRSFRDPLSGELQRKLLCLAKMYYLLSMTQEQAIQGQLFDETVQQFLRELEKTQWKIIRNKVEAESRVLKEQIQEERHIIQELYLLMKREQELLEEIEKILDTQLRCIDDLLKRGEVDPIEGTEKEIRC